MRVSFILSQPLAVDNPQLAENNTSLPEVMVPYVPLYPGDPTEYQTDAFHSKAMLCYSLLRGFSSTGIGMSLWCVKRTRFLARYFVCHCFFNLKNNI